MNGKFVLTQILYLSGILSIVYGGFGVLRLIPEVSAYLSQGINIIDVLSYYTDYIFTIVLSVGNGLTQVVVGWLLREIPAKK